MTERDEEREERIKTRIIVDAYTQDEQAMGWHIYLDETMDFPFEARCVDEQEVSRCVLDNSQLETDNAILTQA